MKRLLSLCLCPLVFLVSCGHRLYVESEGRGNLVVLVENFSADALRTIAPSQITLANLQDVGQYKLRLSGITGRVTLPEQDLTFTNGRATLPDVPAGLWELTLSAYTAAGNVRVLTGKATVQVRAVGASEASFLLRPVEAGTGTINLTLVVDQQDRNILSGGSSRSIGVTLTNRNTGAQQHGGSYTQVLASYTYVANGQIPAGEYELKITLSGGSLPSDASATWTDNLYVEAGQVTTGTVTLPQLLIRPDAPTDFFAQTSGVGTPYRGYLSWGRGYNADKYEVELKMFTSGDWNTPGASAWDSLSGGAVYAYSHQREYPAGGPALMNGGLGRYDELMDLSITRSQNQHWVARIRAVNSFGASDWTYLPTLLNPAPVVTAVATSVAYPPGNNNGSYIGYNYFNVESVTIDAVDYAASYSVEVYRLVKLDNTVVDFYDVNTDKGWESNLTNARIIAKHGYGATNIAFPSLAAGMQFCMRIQAVSGVGKSAWTYYDQIVQNR